jgi:hypothetical protein
VVLIAVCHTAPTIIKALPLKAPHYHVSSCSYQHGSYQCSPNYDETMHLRGDINGGGGWSAFNST